MEIPVKSSIVVGVVAYALLLDYLLYGMAVPLTPHAPANIQHEQFGLLYGAYAISVLVVTPLFGYFGDRVGARATLFCGVILGGLSSVLFAIGSTFVVLTTAKLCQGAASAASWTAGLALIAEHYTERRVEMMGYALTGSTAGSVLGPLLADYCIARPAMRFLSWGRAPCSWSKRRCYSCCPRKAKEGRSRSLARAPVQFLDIGAGGVCRAGRLRMGNNRADAAIPSRKPRHQRGSRQISVHFFLHHLRAQRTVGRMALRPYRDPDRNPARLPLDGYPSAAALNSGARLPNRCGSLPGQCRLCLDSESGLSRVGNALDRAGMSCYAAAYALYNISYSIGMLAVTAVATATAAFLSFRGMLLSVSTVLGLCAVAMVSTQLWNRARGSKARPHDRSSSISAGRNLIPPKR